jgi:oligopeptide/dipeptide ABC transporter ATP-binding protein
MNDDHSMEAGPHLKPSTPALRIQNLRVEFPTALGDPIIAVKNLTLEIEHGTILGLVGESGAGKTTLARSILNLPPVPGRITSGECWFEGTDFRKLPESEQRERRGRDLSIVVPNPRGELNPLIPVGDQIATRAQIHLKISKADARARALEMLQKVHIPDPTRRMKAYANELSGGMAQRVVIAMALVCSPRFVISDDASSGLDVTVQAQILKLMRELAVEQQSAMLFITRDVGITAHFCDRIAVMYAGEIMEIASREDLFLRPRHPYTIMLMAAFSHNARLRAQWHSPDVKRKASDPKIGCSYANRCPLAQDTCRSDHPPLRNLAPGHMGRCHFPLERA